MAILDTQKQQFNNLVSKIKSVATGENPTQNALADRVRSILGKADEAGKSFKRTLQDILPDEVITPGKPVQTVVQNIPTVMAKEAVGLIPTTPTEIATTFATGPVVGGALKVAKPILRKVSPNLVERIGGILKKPVFEKTAAPAGQAMAGGDALKQPVLNIERTREVADEAIKNLKNLPENDQMFDKSKKVMDRIFTAIDEGSLMPESLDPILKQNNITVNEFAKFFKDSSSKAGQQLYHLSRVAKEINKSLPDAEKIAIPQTWWDVAKKAYIAVDTPRRALLVPQLVTAARNAISQGATYTLNIIDDAISGTLQTVTKFKSPLKTLRPAVEDVMAVFRRFSPASREKLNEILDNDLIEKARMSGNVMGDLTLGSKVYKVLNVTNIAQEDFFRKMALDSKLNSVLAAAGKSIATATKDDIKDVLPQAVDHALKLTYSSSLKNGLGKAINNVYKEIPMLTSINPFPRFWANAQRFLVDHSPLGFARMFNPKFIAKMASNNPKEAFDALAKAQTGTLMLSGALAIRNSDLAGEKWYELKIGKDKYVDLRAFAPFSTYMFLAEAMKDLSGQKTNLKGSDYAEGLIAINRIAGSGLAIIDWLKDNTALQNEKSFKRILGSYVSGFTVPFRTLSDFAAGIGMEEKYTRSTTTRPVTGPIMASVPWLSRQLPYARAITRKDVPERENPILRQLTGITIKTKNPIEQEVDRLGINVPQLSPRTGDATLDLKIKKVMGKVFSDSLNDIVQSEPYKKMNEDLKKEVLQSTVQKIRKQATDIVMSRESKEKNLLLKAKSIRPYARKILLRELLKRGKITKEQIKGAGMDLERTLE